uniref:Uncharacterized protein n=1 Tax=Geospiza parvula TaxID=87175 RepID=A0A8U8BJZ5_GEOPR
MGLGGGHVGLGWDLWGWNGIHEVWGSRGWDGICRSPMWIHRTQGLVIHGAGMGSVAWKMGARAAVRINGAGEGIYRSPDVDSAGGWNGALWGWDTIPWVSVGTIPPGLHTVQWLYGCDLLSDGSIHGSRREGYDGRDLISFDLGFRRFVAADSVGEISRRRWEQEEVAERWTNYLKDVCPEWLQRHVRYGQKELERKEPPDVHVSGREEHGTLILSCHAYGFYPNTIAVSWMKGGETLDQETEGAGWLPNSGGTFHTWARIEVLVEHPGMPEPRIFTWEPTSGGNLTVVVAVSIIAAILILIIVLTGFSVWRLQSGNTRDAGKDVGTNSLSTGMEQDQSGIPEKDWGRMDWAEWGGMDGAELGQSGWSGIRWDGWSRILAGLGWDHVGFWSSSCSPWSPARSILWNGDRDRVTL